MYYVQTTQSTSTRNYASPDENHTDKFVFVTASKNVDDILNIRLVYYNHHNQTDQPPNQYKLYNRGQKRIPRPGRTLIRSWDVDSLYDTKVRLQWHIWSDFQDNNRKEERIYSEPTLAEEDQLSDLVSVSESRQFQWRHKWRRCENTKYSTRGLLKTIGSVF